MRAALTSRRTDARRRSRAIIFNARERFKEFCAKAISTSQSEANETILQRR